MSERTFDVDALGLGGEAVEPVVFAMLDFVGDPQFLHSSVGIITWGNEDWYGLGTLGAIEPIKDSIGYAPKRVRLTLSPVAGEYLNEALNEATWGRLCELYLGVWDGDALTRDPELILRGRMGPPEAMVGPNGAVSVTVEDIRASLDRVNGLRATILEHQREAPGDDFYKWLPQMLDHRFVFNGGQFGANNLQPRHPGPPPMPRPGDFPGFY